MSIANTEITSNQANTYDESPYESFPFEQTKISHLKTIAHIFGLNTPKLETARVLELGCASGGNLIPQALQYPKAKFVGIDLSEAQTKVGRKQIEELGLKNIEIKTASITDLDKSLGEFDYIICHGVISWVPDFVRKAIFEACDKLLSPTGLAYISYNTLPGWNMVRSIRDMMLYHSKDFANVEDQITQSILLLQFIRDSLEGSKTPYADILRNEVDILSGQPRNYLRHDHLEETNFQYYFHEFMSEASKNNMQYLGDVSLASMYVGNLPQKAQEKLKEVTDIVRSEQYMDFITNRRFRSTILCRKNIALNRNINDKSVEDLYFCMNVTPEKLEKDITLSDNSEAVFYYNNSEDNKMNTASPIMKATLYVLSENKDKYLSLDAITKQTSAKLSNINLSQEQMKHEIAINMIRLMFIGYLSCSIESFDNVAISDKPKVSEHLRKELEWNKNTWVTSQLHSRIGIHIFDAYTLRYLDGNNTEDMIIDKLAIHVSKGELTINKGDAKVTDPVEVRKLLVSYLKDRLTYYQMNKLLIG
ncbi:MAG UNVERIFIED_CONTAM: methyltransferase regulatory domain-containing protein [Rickettsiaceae bacterium]|jgi:methyltransferase-like protein/ubiquinone/menaquinone biosynthesis C-methylase UbiE